MSFFDFSAPPGPLRTTFRILYLCFRAVMVERGSAEFEVTTKRCLVLSLLAVLLPLLAWWNALGFLLDELLFPGYRNQKIVAPIFIQGSARSGTTALHRLLARDEQLTAMTSWEILLAPSVTWRRLFMKLGQLDAAMLGGAFAALVAACASRIAAASARVHEVQLFGAEEDEWLMAHVGSAQLLAFFFPVLGELAPVIHFDDKLPTQTKAALLGYYQSCIRRHLYAHGGKQTYVAKNPTFNRRIRWLQEGFPDARFVVMTRPPVEAVPSLVSYIGSVWGFFCSPRRRCPLARALTDLQPAEIAYPLDMLASWPASQRTVLPNAALRKDCRGAMEGLYRGLGLTLSPEFGSTLESIVDRSRGQASVHHHSVADTGMSVGEFEAHFAQSVTRLERLEHGEWL